MSDAKISALPSAATLTGAERLPVSQSNQTRGATAAQLLSSSLFTQTGTGAIARSINSKFGDIVSVKDFGAVGDGVTDDTTAITAVEALPTSVKSIYVPEGTYITTLSSLSKYYFGPGTISLNGTLSGPGTSSRFGFTQPLGVVQSAPIAFSFSFTASGHADGTADPRFLDVESTISGANNFTGGTGIVAHNHFASSGTAGSLAAFSGSTRIESTGTITAASAFNGAVHLVASSGNVTTGSVFLAKSQIMTGSGTITTLSGFEAQDMGHATQVANVYGLLIRNQTAATTLTAGIRSLMSAGATKYDLYLQGGAQNLIKGPIFLNGTTGDIFANNGDFRCGTNLGTNALVLVNSATIGTFSPTGLALTGVVSTTDPAGGAGPSWKLGIAAAVAPTAPNRTVRIDIAGTTYYLAAKLTND